VTRVSPVIILELRLDKNPLVCNFNENEMETLLGILGAIRTEITNKRILIKP
jgi:hypothetical protein